MKKTIAALALSVSATASFALVGPLPDDLPGNGQAPARRERPVYCVEKLKGGQVTHSDDSTTLRLDSCDSSRENRLGNRPLLQNGCAEGQVAISSNLVIAPCHTMVQL